MYYSIDMRNIPISNQNLTTFSNQPSSLDLINVKNLLDSFYNTMINQPISHLLVFFLSLHLFFSYLSIHHNLLQDMRLQCSRNKLLNPNNNRLNHSFQISILIKINIVDHKQISDLISRFQFGSFNSYTFYPICYYQNSSLAPTKHCHRFNDNIIFSPIFTMFIKRI